MTYFVLILTWWTHTLLMILTWWRHRLQIHCLLLSVDYLCFCFHLLFRGCSIKPLLIKLVTVSLSCLTINCHRLLLCYTWPASSTYTLYTRFKLYMSMIENRMPFLSDQFMPKRNSKFLFSIIKCQTTITL